MDRLIGGMEMNEEYSTAMTIMLYKQGLSLDMLYKYWKRKLKINKAEARKLVEKDIYNYQMEQMRCGWR